MSTKWIFLFFILFLNTKDVCGKNSCIQNIVENFDFGPSENSIFNDTQYTREDRENFLFYKSLFSPEKISGAEAIPKKAHFISLFPSASLKEVQQSIQTFRRFHPDWEVYLWTDAFEDADFSETHVCNPWQWENNPLRDYCFFSQTKADKLEALKFGILYAMGGVVLDGEFLLQKSMPNDISTASFFCALAPINTSFLSSVIRPSTCILGSTAKHPVIVNSVERIQATGMSCLDSFNGNDPINTLYRTQQLFSFSLDQALKTASSDTLKHVCVMPTALQCLGREESLPIATEEIALAKFKTALSHLHNTQRNMTYALCALCILCVAQLIIVISRKKEV